MYTTPDCSLQDNDSNTDDHLDISHDEDILNFTELSAQLIAAATAADIDDIPSPLAFQGAAPSAHLSITIPPHTSGPSVGPISREKTSIPLKILFKYPSTEDLDSVSRPDYQGMDFFWNGGIENLNREMESYDLLFSGTEITKNNSDIHMPDAT